MKSLFSVYKWPLIAVVVWIAVAVSKFGTAYLSGLWATLQDINWWVENTFSVIIFTVVIAWVVGLSERNREKKGREPYEGRKIILKGLTNAPKPQGIHWQDAQKNDLSSFEKWKFIKSSVSSICWINTETLEEAEKRWVSYSDKIITIDFSKMIEADVSDRDWPKLQEKLAVLKSDD